MSLTSTMFTGASGILNNAEGMSVIGNNISNVNTIGFKGSRMLFSDVLSTVIGNTSVGQVGHGVQIQKVDTVFTQSSNETTTSPTDVFIQGKSFFAVAAPGTTKGPVPSIGALYTRAGSFRLDTTGYNLINPDNYAVLDSKSMPIAFKKDSTSIATPGTTNFPNPPVTGTAWSSDNTNPDTTATYAPGNIASINGINYICIATPLPTVTGGTIFESPAVATAYWTRGTFQGAVTDDTYANPPVLVAATYVSGDVVEGSNGAKYVHKTATSTTSTDPVTDTTNWDIILDFQKVLNISIKGEISLLYADALGNSSTLFYNGRDASTNDPKTPVSSSPGVYLGIAKVPNPQGLVKEGSSLYRESGVIIGGSGTPTIGAPNGTTESVICSNLELSSVDLALEFVKMIQTQRAYSANSKTITTADEMMQEILNLKR